MYADFNAEFDRVITELTKTYGFPSRNGDEDDEVDGDFPLTGVFNFAIWNVDDRLLFVAASHEDRELPILLMIGTAASND